MPRRSWPAQAGLAALWGLSFLFLRGVVTGFGWALAACLLCLVVAISMAVGARLAGRGFGLGGQPTQLLILGAALAGQNLGLCLALDSVGVALTAVVLGAMPLFATLIGQVWGVERITGKAAIGLAVGFLGLLLVVAFPAEGDSWAFIIGILAGLLGAVSAGFANRYASLRLGGRPEASAGASLVAAILTLPFVLVVGGRAGSAGGYLMLVMVALLAAAIGPLFGNRTPSGRLGPDSVLKAAGMVIAALAGITIGHEALSGGQVVGMLLMAGGIVLVLGLIPERVLSRCRRDGSRLR